MKNADKFKAVFGLYATELWSMSEEDFLKWLNSESTETEQRWIPCSERLPEEAGTYLCTCVNAERWIVTLIKWQPRMRSWNLTGARAYWKVVAWKPLPEPYKEGEQDG